MRNEAVLPLNPKDALLICVDIKRDKDFEYLVSEAIALVNSADYNIVEVVRVKRAIIDRQFLIGSGKVSELKELCRMLKIGTVIINHNLSPLQERNLAVELKLPVIDKTGLILDIFASRASSNEGIIQVDLAQQTHQLSRLVRRWTHLERQRGGMGKLGGPGETQIELDRRLIRDKIKKLKDRLKAAVKERQTRRRRRVKNNVTQISIVGYTNAGKSTLFNALTKSDVYVENRLFATLDTTSRKLFISTKDAPEVMISDTVGFIRDLPHSLVASFRATLEETIWANLLLHVVDVHDEIRERQINDVNKVLTEIKANTIPQLIIYNKIDLLKEKIEPKIDYNEFNEPVAVYISAEQKLGLDLIKEAILEKLRQQEEYE